MKPQVVSCLLGIHGVVINGNRKHMWSWPNEVGEVWLEAFHHVQPEKFLWSIMFMFQSGKTKTYEFGGLPKSCNSGDIFINHFVKGPSINLRYALLQCLNRTQPMRSCLFLAMLEPPVKNSGANLLKWCNPWISSTVRHCKGILENIYISDPGVEFWFHFNYALSFSKIYVLQFDIIEMDPKRSI